MFCSTKKFLSLSNGEKIHYTLSEMKSAPFIIVLCHGLGTSKQSKTNTYLQEYLHKKNCPTLSFDFSGHGKSSGNFENVTISECVYNLESIISFLKQKKSYTSIGVIGSSFGGLISLITASKVNHSMNALGLNAPVSNPKILPKIVANHLGTTLDTWKGTSLPYDHGRKLHYTFVSDANSINYNIENIDIPLITAHGVNDFIVPATESERIFWNRDSCLMLTARNIEHGFQERENYFSLLKIVASFVLENLHSNP